MRLRKPCDHGKYDPHTQMRYDGRTFKEACPGGEFLADDALIREWRCWREDGTYHGPCPPVGERWRWETWREDRHGDCGWQWYFMETDAREGAE